MRFKCEECGKTFIYAAKVTHFLEPKEIQKNEDTTLTVGDWVEASVCPFCQSLNFTEYIESVEAQPVEAVYVYDLTSGMQEGLNKLLAEGFEIIARYSKQYMLEKKRKIEPEIPEADMEKAREAYEKLDGGKK